MINKNCSVFAVFKKIYKVFCNYSFSFYLYTLHQKADSIFITMEKKFMRKRRRSFVYFTLMEMVVVIAIIALLATIVTPLYFRHVKKARESTTQTQIKLLEQAIFDFRLDTGKLPSSLDDLNSNKNGDKKWDGPYLKQSVPKDPWGNAYIYICPGAHGEFDLLSYGGDGQSGGTGDAADIGNWGPEDHS